MLYYYTYNEFIQELNTGGVLKKLVLFIVCLFASSASYAETSTFRFGLMPTISVYNLNDPSGPTDQGNNLSLLSGVMFADAGRDSRFMLQASYDKFTLNATSVNVGQDVTRGAGSIAYQTMFRLSRNLKPWFGFGIGEASETYKNRYALVGGFSNPLTPSDRSVNDLFVLIDASMEWEVSRTLVMGFNVQYDQPTGDSSRALKMGVYLTF